jgi:hypothetical protein
MGERCAFMKYKVGRGRCGGNWPSSGRDMKDTIR